MIDQRELHALEFFVTYSLLFRRIPEKYRSTLLALIEDYRRIYGWPINPDPPKQKDKETGK